MSELTMNTASVADAANEIPEEQRQRCEVWTRVMGYHRPVASFNRGKQGEYADRVPFVEDAPRLD